jgi:hypothetical protein
VTGFPEFPNTEYVERKTRDDSYIALQVISSCHYILRYESEVYMWHKLALLHVAFKSLRNFFKLLWRNQLILEVFYGTQYHFIPPVENDSYVIKKDLYVRIRRLKGWYAGTEPVGGLAGAMAPLMVLFFLLKTRRSRRI